MPTNPSEFEFDTWVHRYRESDKETDGNRARDTEREPERERCREREMASCGCQDQRQAAEQFMSPSEMNEEGGEE